MEPSSSDQAVEMEEEILAAIADKRAMKKGGWMTHEEFWKKCNVQ
jgi:hypothetical protein